MNWSRVLDFFWSPCPSGLPHRVRWDVVTNVYGKQYCFHRDCMEANFREVALPPPPRWITEEDVRRLIQEARLSLQREAAQQPKGEGS